MSTLLKPIRLGEENSESYTSSQATGFFWERGGTWYLVTNLHVVTGWDSTRNCSLSVNGFSPTHIEFQIMLEVESSSDSSASMHKRSARRFELSNDGIPLWLEHPKFGSQIDVAILPLFETPSEIDLEEIGAKRLASIAVNLHADWTEFDLAVADDAYVLGYPKGMSGGGFPIWKRASIATEPDIDVDELPKLLIDTATRQGMSGSPVIAIRRGVIMPNGVLDHESIIGEGGKLVGVYSGRIGDDELGVQLGIVWKACVIDEIIDGNCRGKWPWEREAQ